MLKRFFAAMATFVFVSTGAVNAATMIPDLFNTGVDDGGAVLTAGSTDTHYLINETGNQAIVIRDAIPGSWLPNDATSRWIWHDINGNPINVTRTFELSFDLTGFDHTTASLSGRWSTDNTGLDILINGSSTEQTCGGFTVWCDFSVSSDFISGVDTLSFVVNDFGGISGFRAEFLDSSVRPDDGGGTPGVIPLPASLPLLAAGLGVFGLIARRKRKFAL